MMRLFIISAKKGIHCLPNQASSRTDLHIPTPNHSPRPGVDILLKQPTQRPANSLLLTVSLPWQIWNGQPNVFSWSWFKRLESQSQLLGMQTGKKNGGHRENLQKPSKRYTHTAPERDRQKFPWSPAAPLVLCLASVSALPLPTQYQHRHFLPGLSWVSFDILYPGVE